MKIISRQAASRLINDDCTLGVGGSGGSGSPECILREIRSRYLNEHHPNNITLVAGICVGNMSEEMIGLNCLAEEGLIGKAICAHVGMSRLLGEAIDNNQFPAYTIPLGVYGHLLRAISAHEPGFLTHIGLNTFVDPRIDGACANKKAKDLSPIVKLLKIQDKDYLFFKSFPIDVCIIKASLADEDGNISLESEAIIGEQFQMAAATHNSGGTVIVEVSQIVPRGQLNAKNVIINRKLVDYIVVGEQNNELGDYNLPGYRPELLGLSKLPVSENRNNEISNRKVCARRAAMELYENNLVNLGIGFPEEVSKVAQEEGFLDKIVLSVEMGPTGGLPLGGVVFGASVNPESIISTADNFDLYHGGVLDVAILGAAEIDQYGNVNVSKFASRVTGPGGFIDITQSTSKIIFVGSFTAGGLKEGFVNGKLNIIREGSYHKFVPKVQQITFSSQNAKENHQEVLYVTERAVFQLVDDGILLVEIAPGVDLQKDILNQMSFKPLISSNLKVMHDFLFR